MVSGSLRDLADQGGRRAVRRPPFEGGGGSRVQDARRRYRAGAKALLIIRVVDPDGNLTVIDFEREAVMERPEIAALRKATQARDRARAAADAATQAWQQAIRDTGASGVPEAAIARAAGTTIGHVRRVVGRQ